MEKGRARALEKADADRPTLSILRAVVRQNGSTAVIVATGGGYTNLAMDKERRRVSSRFNAMGVTAFVLKYRLGPRYHHPIELGDAKRAVRVVRSRTASLGMAADRIAMMGFSAGGHLAATSATHFDDGNAGVRNPVDRLSSRPDALILAYPVISFDPAIARSDSVRSLLGDNPSYEPRQELSAELPVPPRTPSMLFLALRQAKVPAGDACSRTGRTESGLISEIRLKAHGPRSSRMGRGRGACCER